ncbi:MAG: hypothetical protein ACK5YR_20940 [Pirellula sp.]|jgi:hypothetical protein
MFNHGEPLAFFLTWTTYGTWLPGDERGWTDARKGKRGYEPRLYKHATDMLSEPPFTLSEFHRSIVFETISDHCNVRNWILHSCNPRTNHVHVVVTAPSRHPKDVRIQFQSWCTRRLRERGLERKNVWTENGSERYLNTDFELEAAIKYSNEAQDLKWKEHKNR